MTDIREIFEDWCREADIEPTAAGQEAFKDGYNARARYDDARDAEIERLRAGLLEANRVIYELQQAACDRAGVPMPSQRSVVDRQKAEIEQLRAAAKRSAVTKEAAYQLGFSAGARHEPQSDSAAAGGGAGRPMTDLVERLLDTSKFETWDDLTGLIAEAAVEIERLRAVLRAWEDAALGGGK